MAHSDELHTRPEDQSVANNEAREVALGNEHLRRALEQRHHAYRPRAQH